MIESQQQRGWLLIATLAIGIALVLLLAPHTSGGGVDWLAILPIFFVGMISPLRLCPALAFAYTGRRPDAPSLPARFQRPPPIA